MTNDFALVTSGIADFLSAVAWPTVTIVIVFKFSGNISQILEAIRLRILIAKDLSLKMGAVQAAASGFVEEAAKSAREMILRTAAPASEVGIEEAAKAIERAESAPTPVEQVRLAQEAVSDRLRDLLSADEARGRQTLEELATAARRAAKISLEAELSIQQLASLARIVRESGASAASERAAKAYSSLAQAVLQSLPYPT